MSGHWTASRSASGLISLGFGIATGLSAWAQNAPLPEQDLVVKNVRLESQILVRVALRNSSDKRLLIPYCGELSNELYLCSPGANVEVRSGNEWKPPLLHCCGVLGGQPNHRTVPIESQETKYFVYQIRADLFNFRRGQVLRLVTAVWPDGSVVGDGKAMIRLATAPFEMP
jgi:hypothetical protein